MPDREKVIKGLIACTSESSKGDSWHNHEICPYVEDCVTKNVGIGMPVMFDALALLKEQQNEYNYLQKLYCELQDENALLKEQEIVRCKDCKYGSLCSDENVIMCDKFSKTRDKNWFCADGERK